MGFDKARTQMKGQTSDFALQASRERRTHLTDAELKLWRRLRGRQLGVKFRRQHPFKGYVLDFVCLEQGLVVEVDGAQHAEQQARDEARTLVLREAGMRVLRFWNNEVLNQTDDVVAEICRVLDGGD